MKKVLVVALCCMSVCISITASAHVSKKAVSQARERYLHETNPELKAMDNLTYKGLVAIRHDQRIPSIFKRRP